MTDIDRKDAALGLILELVVLLSRDMAERFARDGLTDSRVHLIWELAHRGPSTQRALADALQVSARNITGLVDALVATGFVTREPHPTDRRATLVSFTKKGAAVAESLQREQKEFAQLLFGQMPTAQFDCFVDAMSAIVERIRKEMEK